MAQSIMSGKLYKSPPREKLKNKFADKWKLRWFVLWSNKTLSYFDDSNSTKAKGEIPLDKVELQDIRHPLVMERRNWVIAINVKAQSREYYLAADDEKTMLSWVKALKEALKIDYILVSEIASSNLMCIERTPFNESVSYDMQNRTKSYIEILPGVDRMQSADSNITDLDEKPEINSESDVKRQSAVSPYEVYDQDSIKICNSNIFGLENSESKEIDTNEDGTYYTAMKMLNSLSSADGDGDEAQACSSDPKSPMSPNSTLEDNACVFKSSSKSGNYVVASFGEQDRIPEESELLLKKPSHSADIYETMTSPPVSEPVTIHEYDELAYLTEIMEGLEVRKIKNQEARAMSSDYDDVLNLKEKNGPDEEIPVPVRPNRSNTDIPVNNEISDRPRLPPKSPGIGFKEDFRKSVFGQFHNLLDTYWVMYIFLPNKLVVKELVNIESSVDNLVQKLAKFFTGQKYHHDFNLYVISDIHQTFETLKKTENAKNDRRLNNDMPFISQGINSAKLLQLVSIKEIDQHAFNQYLKDKEESNHIQRFCETWITFVRGYFSIPDLREVAALSGYIHYVYQTIFTSKSVSFEIFLPKNAREIPECVKKVREQSLQLKDTSIQTACDNFKNRLSIWPTANTIAFPIKRIGKGVLVNKQSDLLIIFANDHIGIVKAEKNTDYSNFIYWWHKLDIGSFSINSKENLVIKLTKPIDEGSCEFNIKSSMNKIMCQLLENFLTEKKIPLTKRASLGAIAIQGVRKPLPDVPTEVDIQ